MSLGLRRRCRPPFLQGTRVRHLSLQAIRVYQPGPLRQAIRVYQPGQLRLDIPDHLGDGTSLVGREVLECPLLQLHRLHRLPLWLPLMLETAKFEQKVKRFETTQVDIEIWINCLSLFFFVYC